MEITKKFMKAFEKLEKEGIKENKEKFKNDALKLIDNSEMGMIVMTEKSCATLGMEPTINAILFSTIETLIESSKNKEVYLDGLHTLIERVEGKDE